MHKKEMASRDNDEPAHGRRDSARTRHEAAGAPDAPAQAPVAAGFPLLTALLAGGFGVAIGWLVLTRAQPQEDAFILFKYARNLAEGHGIVYYPGGPHAEGATDFLWMILLAGAHRLGVDVAVAAMLANAFGAALLTFVAARFVPLRGAGDATTHSHGARDVARGAGPSAFAARLLRHAPLVFLLTGPAFAGYMGFSAMLYCGLSVTLFAVTLSALIDRRNEAWIPFLALILALFRPDGVVLGGGFALLGLVAAWRAREQRPYLTRCGAVVAIAIAYMVWRRAYFGLNLPLPLYVKGHFTNQFSLGALVSQPYQALVGLENDVKWLTAMDGPLPLLAGTVVLVVLAGRERRRVLGAYALCLLPAVALLAALAVAWQSQNIGGRFQGPALAIVFAGLFFWAGRAVLAGRAVPALLVTLAALAPSAWYYAPRVSKVWNMRGYVDTFAVDLGHILPPERTIALTEAGRLSYWTSARVEDLVGLNTARTALAPADTAYLEGLSPDVVLFYADPFDLRGALGVAMGDTTRPMISIDCETLQRGLKPAYRDAYEHPSGRYTSFVPPERYAAMAAMRYLCSRDDYEIWTVLHLGNYSHVWAFKKDLPELPGLKAALRIALEDTRYLSYRAALADQ